ncbi:MAG: DUF87 domain-containing protein [Vicinamibacterales bacterium]
MKRIEIGPGVACDVATLLNTRLQVQANSGAGKSWLLRRLLEQTHGQVQQLVIDPEGEFGTLRERFDYVLASKDGGDTSVDPRAAKLLAERLLELGVSAILDIYELKAPDRILFVQRFLEALVNAPKRLWHPVLVVIDEAHVFAPQVGSAPSAGAVIDLCARGRKRGFCAVLATQRLSKLHKDAAAECNNKLIGRTSLDVDVTRAADELGFSKEQARGLRKLENGQFYAFGPALTREVTPVTVGPVATTHPKAGARLAAPPPAPSDRVKAILAKLADLPAEAAAQAQTEADLRRALAEKDREIKQLQADVSGFSNSNEREKSDKSSVEVLTDGDRAYLRTLIDRLADIDSQIRGEGADSFAVLQAKAEQAVVDALVRLRTDLSGVVAKRHADFTDVLDKKGLQRILDKLDRVTAEPAAPPSRLNAMREVAPSAPRTVAPSAARDAHDASEITPVGQRILDSIAELVALGARTPQRSLVALLAGYTNLQSKGFVNALSALSAGGSVSYPGPGLVALEPKGAAEANPVTTPRTPAEVQERVIQLLGGACGRILRPIIDAYPGDLARTDAAAAAGYGNLQSKGFVNALSRLSSLGFVTYPDRGRVKAADVLFLKG